MKELALIAFGLTHGDYPSRESLINKLLDLALELDPNQLSKIGGLYALDKH